MLGYKFTPDLIFKLKVLTANLDYLSYLFSEPDNFIILPAIL